MKTLKYLPKIKKNYASGILTSKFQRFHLFQRNQLISTYHRRWAKSRHFQSQHCMGLQDNFDRLPLNLFFEFRKFQKQMDFFDNFQCTPGGQQTRQLLDEE